MSTRGRKARRPIETLKSKAWGTYVFHLAGAETQHQFEKIWLGAGGRIPRVQQVQPAPEIHRSKKGVKSPNHQTLVAVERYFPGTQHIYTNGIGVYPLWDMLDGSIELSKQLLITHVTEFHGIGLIPPISAYLGRIVGQYFGQYGSERAIDASGRVGPILNWLEVDYKHALGSRNVVADNLAPHLGEPLSHPDPLHTCAGFSIDDIAVIFAAYRLAVFTGDRERDFLYYLNGISAVISTLLAPWGIEKGEIITLLQGIWDDFYTLDATHICAKK